MRESIIEDTVVASAENAGWLVRKLSYVGRRGAPDRWFMKDGVVIFVEFKRSGKKRADPLQQREHLRMRNAGFTVHVIDNIESGLALLGLQP